MGNWYDFAKIMRIPDRLWGKIAFGTGLFYTQAPNLELV